ncbi:hypothetical protein AGABI2DRAFT_145527 [Agaricus bisporus var. bisporus H97]|uniref:hypothetical protein n=1 Tax=Agaricus bisporus var. bisporus (strain H97 / ATCC MYA-4626 / FGSC 10389) TaxID=936046 RepID=UPI00029F700A|nr:hypothetical protein AGABI2DRAFT_145527 [Agaricus bisporus var. bisporus H97]EKV44081.1 hypothetical protein AGABI2DRAFT_145527 [Agaricus bisporus var. bisporus H97]
MILSPADHERAAWLLGPWLLGGALGIFLQGILYCQFMRYAIHFKSDGLGIKIDYFADLEGAIALSYTSWWESASSLINATLDLYVQVFFVRRLFLISNRNCHVCGFAAHFSALTREDVLPHRPFHLPYPTNMAIRRTSYAMLWPGTDRLLSALFNTMLPKLYAMSMMWTLNARLELRAMSTGSSDVTSGRMIFDPPFDTSLQVILIALSSPGKFLTNFQHTHNSGRSLPARTSLESGHRVDVRTILRLMNSMMYAQTALNRTNLDMYM